MVSRSSSLEKEPVPAPEKQRSNPYESAPTNAKIHNIAKYLEPIAGVLEGVLTSGGNEVLDQI